MTTACSLAAIVFAAASIVQCIALKYDPSKTYVYSYHTDVLLNNADSKKLTRPQQDVGVKLSLAFTLSTVYNDANSQLFKLAVTKSSATSVIRPDVQQEIGGSLSLPVYFQLSEKGVESLYFEEKDSIFSRNIKKGIMALFQVQEKPVQRTEVDVSGECLVSYESPEPGVVQRTKSDCQNMEIANQFSNTNKALGVSMYIRSIHHYQLKNSIIEKVTGTHKVISYLNIRTTLNGGATASQNLQYESESAGSELASSFDVAISKAEAELGSKLSPSVLPSEEEIQHCTEGCESPKNLAANLSEDLKADNIATVKSAKAFAQMLKSFRGSGKATISELMTSQDSYYIVPQLIDVATATQTEAAREALLDLLDFEDSEAVEYPQRFLFAAAYSSHPSQSLITDLLSVLKKPIPNESLRESLLLSLGAIVHTFCQIPEQCKLPIVEDFKNLVTSGLSACEEETCKLMYLRALGNAGLPGMVPVILPFAESPASPMIASTAIAAFRRIRDRYITKEVKAAMLRIFHQNKSNYDSSVRVAALELLLDNGPSDQVIRNVLLSCLDQSNVELSTYVIRLLLDAAASNPSLSSQISSVLQDLRINNYNVLAQKGKSSVITSFLAKMKDVNSTYNLYFENSASGVMKRSGMIVSLLGKTIKQPFMKFGIYADGLESLVGEEEAAQGEDDSSDENSASVEATAGMSFLFMDVLLTQVEFFRGTAGLMSAAWNAPSELTSALQGNLLLQDHSQRVHLSNGLVLDTNVLGVLSMDLSGSISISLWNRNCEALIRNSGAMYLEGSLRIDSKELDVGLKFTGEGESNIDFTSNADFYEMPLKLCMQMKRPEFEFWQKVHKYEKLLTTKKYKSSTSVKSKMCGESYFLNKANSEECRLMLQEA